MSGFGINQNLYYRWSKELLEASKMLLASVPFDGRQRDPVDFSAANCNGPDITFQSGVDLPVGGIDVVFHEIDGEFLTPGT